MKAKVKDTGIVIEVCQFGSDLDLWRDKENKCVYHKSALIFMGDTIDWEQRRYEIAKEIYPTTIKTYLNGAAVVAVKRADELIKQLKDQSMKGCKSDESSVEDWTPSIGSTFYFVDSTGEIAEGRLLDSKYDEKIVQSGNRFKTREAAQPYAEKFKAIFRPGKR